MKEVNYDIFNGDADGICALHQLCLANPRESELITGVKRDIQLVQKVDASVNDNLVVLDISFDKNRMAVEQALNAGANVAYYDHHFAGTLPKHENLTCFINTNAETCTSLIVNEQLKGRYVKWAITAAFGDNLHVQAIELSEQIGMSVTEIESLKTLGSLINYNGYGSAVEDLHFAPDALYQIIKNYEDPFDFIKNEKAFLTLKQGYEADLEKVQSIAPDLLTDKHGVYLLPDASWARRISGVYGNILTQQTPSRAHAILSLIDDKYYVVSVRAPIDNREGADDLCRQFETGGGRKAAAGINKLPISEYSVFVEKFKAQFK